MQTRGMRKAALQEVARRFGRHLYELLEAYLCNQGNTVVMQSLEGLLSTSEIIHEVERNSYAVDRNALAEEILQFYVERRDINRRRGNRFN